MVSNYSVYEEGGLTVCRIATKKELANQVDWRYMPGHTEWMDPNTSKLSRPHDVALFVSKLFGPECLGKETVIDSGWAKHSECNREVEVRIITPHGMLIIEFERLVPGTGDTAEDLNARKLVFLKAVGPIMQDIIARDGFEQAVEMLVTGNWSQRQATADAELYTVTQTGAGIACTINLGRQVRQLTGDGLDNMRVFSGGDIYTFVQIAFGDQAVRSARASSRTAPREGESHAYSSYNVEVTVRVETQYGLAFIRFERLSSGLAMSPAEETAKRETITIEGSPDILKDARFNRAVANLTGRRAQEPPIASPKQYAITSPRFGGGICTIDLGRRVAIGTGTYTDETSWPVQSKLAMLGPLATFITAALGNSVLGTERVSIDSVFRTAESEPGAFSQDRPAQIQCPFNMNVRATFGNTRFGLVTISYEVPHEGMESCPERVEKARHVLTIGTGSLDSMKRMTEQQGFDAAVARLVGTGDGIRRQEPGRQPDARTVAAAAKDEHTLTLARQVFQPTDLGQPDAAAGDIATLITGVFGAAALEGASAKKRIAFRQSDSPEASLLQTGSEWNELWEVTAFVEGRRITVGFESPMRVLGRSENAQPPEAEAAARKKITVRGDGELVAKLKQHGELAAIIAGLNAKDAKQAAPAAAAQNPNPGTGNSRVKGFVRYEHGADDMMRRSGAFASHSSKNRVDGAASLTMSVEARGWKPKLRR